MRRLPSNVITLETSIDALKQLEKMGLSEGVSRMFGENVKILKHACSLMNLPLKPVEMQARRLEFDDKFHLYVHVLYTQTLPNDLIQKGFYLKMPLSDIIHSIRGYMTKCGYRIVCMQDQYYLVDTTNNKELKSLNDYDQSLLINQELIRYEDLFENALRSSGKVYSVTKVYAMP